MTSFPTRRSSDLPDEIRPIQCARPADLLNGANPPRGCCGVYEFTGWQAGREYGVRVIADGQRSRELRVKSLPAELPGGTDEWFHILLVSCYHRATAKRGALGGAIADLKKAR